MKCNEALMVLVLASGSIFCGSLCADQIKFVSKPEKILELCLRDALPQKNIEPSKDSIPSFLAHHRVYKVSGPSHSRLVLIDKHGQLVGPPNNFEALPDVTGHQYPGSSFVYPSDNWHIKIEGHDNWQESSPSDRWKITYRKAPGEKETVSDIPNLANSWDANPAMYNDDTATLYFESTEGGTGNRQGLLVRYSASDGRFSIVGLSAGRVVAHPSGNWILWQPGGLADVGGKHVPTASFSMFDVKAGQSLIITSGAVMDEFEAWSSR